MKCQFKEFNLRIKKNLLSLPVILLHGPNQSEIKEKCREVTTLLCGPNGTEEMRINKVLENSILKDPYILDDKIKSVGFFPGKQVLIIEGTTDKIVKILSNVISNWTKEDASIILIASTLKPNSSLRKMLEAHPTAICLAIYDEQNDGEAFERRVTSSTLKIIDQNVLTFLRNPRNFHSYQSFISFIEKLELYKFLDQNPVTFEDIELVFPGSSSPTELEVIECLAMGDLENTFLLVKHLYNSGVRPNHIILFIRKHFTLLHKLSLNLHNADLILNRNYPPIYGQRRQQLLKHAKTWSTRLIERALKIIQTVETEMRSSSKLDLNSNLERSLLRIGSLLKLPD